MSANSLVSRNVFTSFNCLTFELFGRLNGKFKEVESNDSLNGRWVLASLGFDVI